MEREYHSLSDLGCIIISFHSRVCQPPEIKARLRHGRVLSKRDRDQMLVCFETVSGRGDLDHNLVVEGGILPNMLLFICKMANVCS